MRGLDKLNKVITEILPPAHPARGKLVRKRAVKRYKVLANIRVVCATNPAGIASRLARVKGNVQWPDKYSLSDLYLVLFSLGFGVLDDATVIKKFQTKKQSIIFALDTYYTQDKRSVEKLMWRIAKEANQDKPT